MRRSIASLSLTCSIVLIFTLIQSSPAHAQAWILRLLVSAAIQGNPTAHDRPEKYEKLAQRHYYNTIERSVGRTFIVVTDSPRFEGNPSAADPMIPILFKDDSSARIPNLLLKEIEEKCAEGWATVQFVKADMSEETLTITCGLAGPSDSSTTISRQPDKPGAFESGTSSTVVNYLSVKLDSFDVSRQGDIRATLKLKNIDPRLALVVAFKAEHSDGIADFWKFSPYLEGQLSDNAGGNYIAVAASGIGFARTTQDWAVIYPGEERFITLVFRAESRPGTSFNLFFALRMAYRAGPSDEERMGSFPIYLTDIRPRHF